MKITLDAVDRFAAQAHQRSPTADRKGNDLLKAGVGIKRFATDIGQKMHS